MGVGVAVGVGVEVFKYGVSIAKSLQLPAQLVRLNTTDVILAPLWSTVPM